MLFLYHTRRVKNFYSCEKQISKSFSCTKIWNDSKWTKTSRNKVMQPTTSNSDSRSFFPYHVRSQAGLNNPFINKRNFTFLGILKMNKNLTIELVTGSEFFSFFNPELVIRKRKNKSLTIKLVTWSKIKYYSNSGPLPMVLTFN